MARNGHEILLWSLEVVIDLQQAITRAKHVLLSIPSVAFADMLKTIKPMLTAGTPISWATKGLTPDTGRFLYDTALDILGESHPLAVISGPSFAMEVAKDLPTAMTVASKDDTFFQNLAATMHRPTLRVYTTKDVQGVQVGGTVKNILAIGAGISDGLGYGANARAALITRGMAETMRLAASLGAETETMIGLSGVGDLILTCTDNQSRNRQLGLAIGRGLTVEQAVAEVGKTVEGMYAAREVLMRAKQAGIEMPIVEQVYKVLFEGNDPRQAVQALLCREQKPETTR
ncbi:UNVERIFIED_CONTAM: hypothetical protein GTU68_062283 [Idotea baltica]|nr:hypothetical protein [Idotea baltica]